MILRTSRILSNGVVTAIAQGTNLILSLLLISLIQKAFGFSILGIWLATTTLIMLLSISDFGIGNAIISVASRFEAKGHERILCEMAVSGTILTGALGATLFAALFSVTYFGMWSSFFNYNSTIEQSKLGYFFYFVSIFLAINLPLSIVERIQIARQRSYIPKSLEAVGGIIALVVCPFVLQLDLNLGWVFLTRFAPHIVLRTFNSVFFWQSRISYLGRLSFWRISYFCRKLISVGGAFFVMGVSAALALNSDVLIISYILGAERVPEYSVPFRLFIIPTMITGLFSYALWPAYADAMRNSDWVWIKYIYWRAFYLALPITFCTCLALVIFSDAIISIWIGESLYLPPGMLIAMTSWTAISVLGGLASPLLNAAGKERLQARLGILMVTTNVPLSIFLVYAIGPQGAMWGSVVSVFLFITVPIHFELRRMFIRRDQRR